MKKNVLSKKKIKQSAVIAPPKTGLVIKPLQNEDETASVLSLTTVTIVCA